MTDNNHPITPPDELVRQWATTNGYALVMPIWKSTAYKDLFALCQSVATQAARWGSDQELEACCEWFRAQGYHPVVHQDLRAARRPKPPSLAEEALEALEAEDDDRPLRSLKTGERFDIIRAALERLRELEKSND